MATLQIRKKSAKVWAHVISDGDTFILSKMYCKTDGDTFRIVEDGGSSRKEYDYSNITVYDDTDASTPETFLNSQALMLRLSALGYVGFSQDGEVVIADLISTDASNAIELGTDGKLFSSGGGGGGGSTLGLIKIVDKDGDFFTNLSTANAYVSTFTSATITNESYSNGTYWFTVPNGTSFALADGFLYQSPLLTTAYIVDEFGLINQFGHSALRDGSGNNILGNCIFGDYAFQGSEGNNILGDCTFGDYAFTTSKGNNTLGNCTFGEQTFDVADGIYKFKNILLSNDLNYFGSGSIGRFEFYGNIGTDETANYTNFFNGGSDAVIWAQKTKETSNAGGIEGDLATAQTNGAKLFFGYASAGSGSGDMTKAVYDTDDDGIVDSAKKEMVAFINKSGATITKGTIVYLKSSSSSASYPEVLKANATTEATSSKTIGAVYEDVANDATGYVVTSGEVSNLDTSAYAIGDKLWLSTTDGLVTTTAPTQPNHAVFIGMVTRSQSTNGRILYAIQNGYELNELHNVLITSVADKQLLSYDNATSLWKNKSVTTNDIAEDSNLYFTNARAIASTLTSFVAGTGAISSSDTILTAIQKLAGNSGLKKVINDTTASANQTLTTEVVMKTYEITGGTFVSGSKPNITIGSTKTSGGNAAYTMRLYAGSTNVFASATLIATCASSSAFIRGFNFERRSFYFDGTTLNGFIPTFSVRSDITELPLAPWGGMTLNPANSIFLFVTLQNGSALDTTRIDYVNITE